MIKDAVAGESDHLSSQEERPPLLYLVHRIPYPPNKGDKIASFNILRFLARHYQVYLGCFVDDPKDLQYLPVLKNYCAEVQWVDISRRSQLSTGVKALLGGQAVSVAFYESVEMQVWVDQVIEEQQIQRAVTFSSGMCQFISGKQYASIKRFADLVDIDSDKWRQYAERKPFYSAWVYQREYRLIQKIEQRIVEEFDATALVTEEEVRDFCAGLADSLKTKVHVLSNGVDTDYFDPLVKVVEPELESQQAPFICFTGAMDYWANVDAVVWFVHHVWPLVLKEKPELYFYIVGGNPTEQVKGLEQHSQVKVTGRVPDVRPYLAASRLTVAPLRIARGVQNKVLEAMAMAKPVVMTPMAQTGISIPDLQLELVMEDAALMAAKIVALMEEPANLRLIGEANRQWILTRFSWEAALSKIKDIL